jgi:hypothetical protein
MSSAGVGLSEWTNIGRSAPPSSRGASAGVFLAGRTYGIIDCLRAVPLGGPLVALADGISCKDIRVGSDM